MDEGRGRQLLLAMFILALSIITWSEIHKSHRVPLPQRYVGTGLVFGTLGLFAPIISYELTGIVGGAMVLALLYQYFNVPKEGIGQAPSQGIGENPHPPPELNPPLTK